MSRWLPDRLAVATLRQAWLPLVLALFSVWGVGQAVSAWSRPPAPPAPPLPERLQWQGRWLGRRPAAAPRAPWPEGVLLQGGADYGLAGAESVLALRWFAMRSSGDSVSLDPARLALAVLGPGGHGLCRIHHASSGALLGVASDATGVLSLLRRNNPTGVERLRWALGLRPWRSNRCLFVGVVPRR